MMPCWKLLQAAVVALACSPVELALNATYITSLLKQMELKHVTNVPPIETGQPINVYIQMSILDMFPYQSIHMHYSADFYLKLRWFDYRLAFNSSDNSSYVPLKGKSMIWIPDIVFPNGRQGFLQKVPYDNEGSHFYLNGTVVHVQRVTLVSFCLMELHFYPFDIQNCTFEISTMTHSKEYIRLHWDHTPIVHQNSKLEMKEFNIVKYETAIAEKSFGRDGIYDTLQLKFRFYRFLALYFLRDFFPCILIVVLSWMTFWIDYSSTPARVAMGITTVLTIVTMTNNIRSTSPPAGLFRSIDYYLLMCNLFVFAALLEYALVGLVPNKAYKKRKRSRKRNKKKGTELCTINNVYTHKDIFSQAMHEDVSEEADLPEENKRCDHQIDKLSRILFPGLFAVFNAIYFAFHRLHEDTVD